MINYKVQESRILKNIDIDILQVLKKYDCCVAGGTLVSVFNNLPINDYDIYCKKVEDTGLIVEELQLLGFEVKVISKNAFSLVRKQNKEKKQNKLKIQIIKYEKFCNENIIDTFNYFDFHCCMGAYNFKDRQFYFDNFFLADNIEKKLRFNPGTEYPICSLYRTIKYQKKGYTISGIEMIKIALSINNLRMQTFKDLKEQLMGIDTQFLQPLTDKLLKNDELDYNYETFRTELANFYEDYYDKVIDKAFNNQEEEYFDIEEDIEND